MSDRECNGSYTREYKDETAKSRKERVVEFLKLIFALEMENNADAIQRKCFWSLILVSVAELLNFSAFITLEGLQSNVNPQVGMIALGLLYLAFLIASMFLPPLVLSRLECRKTLALSTLTYAAYTAANFYPVSYVIIPSAIVLGVGGALLWSALRVYITKIARWYAVAKQTSVAQTTYWFFGTFFTIFSSAIIIGNVITSVLTSLVSSSDEETDISSLNISMTTTPQPLNTTTNVPLQQNGSAVCGLFYHGTAGDSHGIEQDKMYIILVVFLVMQGLSALICLTLFETEPSTKINEQIELFEKENQPAEAPNPAPQSASKLMKVIFKLLRRDKPALLLVLMTMRLGFFWSFVQGQFTMAWIGCAIGVIHVTRCMAVFGVLMALSSMLSGQLTKLFKINKIIVAAAMMENAVLISLFIWQPHRGDEDVWVFYAVAAAMGFTNGIMKSQTPSVYSLIWTESDEVAASSSLQGLWESLAATILYGLSSIIYPISQLLLVLISLNLGTLTLLWAWEIRDKANRFW